MVVAEYPLATELELPPDGEVPLPVLRPLVLSVTLSGSLRLELPT